MTDDELARIVWNYHVLNQKVEKSDCILALGNSDLRTAEKAANLFNQGYSTRLITTGGLGRLTQKLWHKPEATMFADVAIKLGVPEEKILIEDQSQNTFDNFDFTKNLLTKKNIQADSFIIVTKPYMERRAYAMAIKIWPDKKIIVTSPNLDFNDYPNEVVSKELTINMIVGDLQRIIYWGERDKLEKQEIPNNVMEAYTELLKRGYDKQIIREFT
jgi:uncharacterized SAM-binding protein YcdF (DUF218 family)